MTVALKEVALGAVTVERLRETAGPKGWARLSDAQARAGEVLAGRTVWSINSTAVGGGVAEMLRTTLAYMRAGGLDTRWLIMPGGTDFFGVTSGSTTSSMGISGIAVRWERRSEASTSA